MFPLLPLLLIVFSSFYYLSETRAYLNHGSFPGTSPVPVIVNVPFLGFSVNYYGSPLSTFPASPNTLLPPPISSRSTASTRRVGSPVNRHHSHRSALTSLVGSVPFRVTLLHSRILGLSWSLSYFDECFVLQCLSRQLSSEQRCWFTLLAFS